MNKQIMYLKSVRFIYSCSLPHSPSTSVCVCVCEYRVIITQTPLVKRAGNFLLSFLFPLIFECRSHTSSNHLLLYIHWALVNIATVASRSPINCPSQSRSWIVSCRVDSVLLEFKCDWVSVFVCINPQNFDVFFLLLFTAQYDDDDYVGDYYVPVYMGRA